MYTLCWTVKHQKGTSLFHSKACRETFPPMTSIGVVDLKRRKNGFFYPMYQCPSFVMKKQMILACHYLSPLTELNEVWISNATLKVYFGIRMGFYGQCLVFGLDIDL